ncbi:MAG: hypothetical protein MOB07_05060 [Acidobacteria bacterium]|nr:hypothetical protein [Acidobacteriota bacterium]
MASPQFLYLLEQLHKNPKSKKLAWRPTIYDGAAAGAFRIALGEGVIRIISKDDDDWMFSASYCAQLLTRDGDLVDEIETSQQFSDEYFTLLRDVFHSARAAAYQLDQLIDGMQDDLEAGRTRELPPQQEEMTHEIPF